MAHLELRDELLFGDAETDGQHRELIASIDRLGDAIAAGHGQDALEATIEDILGYALVHFAAEEALMERAGYPGLRRQREVHAAFAAEAAGLFQAFQTGTAVSAEELHEKLSDWLAEHVETLDLLFARFLRAESESGGH